MTTALATRPQPLTLETFERLEHHVNKHFSVREKFVSKSVPKLDNEGNIYGWERDLVPAGYELFVKEKPDQKLLDAMKRPATQEAIVKHLTRLSMHKKFTDGNSGFKIVLGDLCEFLSGMSEYAVMKVCERFILDTSSKWFPQTAEIVSAVRSLEDQLRYVGEAPKPKAEPQPEKLQERTPTRVRRVNRMCKLAVKPKANWTTWEQKFMAAVKTDRPERKYTPHTHSFGYGENA